MKKCTGCPEEKWKEEDSDRPINMKCWVCLIKEALKRKGGLNKGI